MTNNFMGLALDEAKKAGHLGEVPVGAVIVDSLSNKIVACCGNSVEENGLPTRHAEINAIELACGIVGSKFLDNCDIYVSLEPCAMCAQAISYARLRRLYFAAYDLKSGGVEHGARVFDSDACHFKPDVYGGIMEEESAVLLRNFFKSKR